MKILIIAPIIIPFLTAIVMVFFWKKPALHRILNLAGFTLILLSSLFLLFRINDLGIYVLQVGDWRAPFGISLVADLFSAIMVAISGIIGFSTAIYSLANIDLKREKFGYYPLLQILMMGINGAFLTGDIFNLYVWFEVMLISSFVLLALGGRKEQLEGAIKYVTINLISSAIFLASVGILYGLVGTLNMADIGERMSLVPNDGMITVLAILFLTTFGIKSAVFPLFFWLPASYHTPPAAVSAIFAGMLTKVGVYAMFRIFTLIFNQNIGYTHTIILVIAGLTMFIGVLGAAAQNNFRRVLSFHIVSQIGYMIMGLGLFSPLAVAGGVFYIIHHIIVKTNLFFVSGIVHRLKGSYELKELGGVYKKYPLLGLLFLIPAFSLAGIPPLSGFWSKYFLAKAGLEIGQVAIVVVSLVVGLLTLFSMSKIWNEVFWKDQKKKTEDYKMNSREKWSFYLPVVLLAALTLAIGFGVNPVFNLAERAAQQLLNPEIYIAAVLKGK